MPPSDDRISQWDVGGRGPRSSTSSNARSYSSSILTKAPPAQKREWLRLDVTQEEDSVLSTDATFATTNTDTSISAFPDPPNGHALQDMSLYRKNSISSTSSSVRGVPSTAKTTVSSNEPSPDFDRLNKHETAPVQTWKTHEGVKESMRHTSPPKRSIAKHLELAGLTDFFGAEVYQIVLRNPTTAHRLLKFCQKRSCGENMEFLEKVDRYYRLLDEVTVLLGDIHKTYTSSDASRQINISGALSKQIGMDIRKTTQTTLPAMEQIFLDAQGHIETLLSSEIYPRFVQHQVTTSAALALSGDKSQFQGLGDCFCLTDPRIADNPIMFASDGFVDVTGYDRQEIVSRNCRFLQGSRTDSGAVRRLRASIDNAEETVELMLNYRKNGDPFWNLLYISPLFDQHGNVSFFLGGQINCSTTIHSCTDVLRVLSLGSDDELDNRPSLREGRPATVTQNEPSWKSHSDFFKSRKGVNTERNGAAVLPEVGMEGKLIENIGRFNFKTQVEAFYTAYSKYLVMSYDRSNGSLSIKHYSPTSIDLLCLYTSAGQIAPIFDKDIFKVFADFRLDPETKQFRSGRQAVRDAMRASKAISLELGLLTGTEVRKVGMGGVMGRLTPGGGKRVEWCKAEEKFIMHWTPLKDKQGEVRFAILTIAPKS